MKSEITQDFLKDLRPLPKDIRDLVRLNFRRFQENPDEPDLHFRPLQGTELYSIHIGGAYRTLGTLSGDVMVWFWIGTHAGIVETGFGNLKFIGI